VAWADRLKGWLAPKLAASQSAKLQKAAAAKTPKMRQASHDAARRSMLGEFAGESPQWLQQCLQRAKAMRRAQRLDLCGRALLACDDHADAAERLRADMDEVENMRCAKHVYLAHDPTLAEELRAPPPGFILATDDDLAQMGLRADMLAPPGSAFRAAVYLKDAAVWGEDAEPAAVLAFRGSTPAQEDWENNFAQDANREAPYYRQAVTIGNALAKDEASVHIVGHSLGGGLASAAQGGSGLTASTYNAAGLHPETVARYSADLAHDAADAGKIQAFRIEGEVLTHTQESKFGTSWVANQAVGQRNDLAPAKDEAAFKALQKEGLADAGEDYAGFLHGMDQVIDAMEARKRRDEALLRGCLAGTS